MEFSQNTIKAVGKSLFILRRQWRRPTCLDTAAPERVHEVAHVEPASDVLTSERFPSGTEHIDILLNQLRSFRNVSSNDKIAGLCAPHNFLIGDIRPLLHLQDPNVGKRRCFQPLVGHQRQLKASALGNPKQHIANHPRQCIRINPYLHVWLTTKYPHCASRSPPAAPRPG